jgi:hypothetical protein
MNKNRFSDKRLAQITSTKELRSTRNKVAIRLEILEDKFENGSWSLFNTESMLYNLTRKAAGIKGAWESAKEIFQNLRGNKVTAITQPETQEATTPKPSRKPRRRKGNKSAEQKNDTPTTPDTPTPAPEAKTSTVEAPEQQTADNVAKESKPRHRRRGGRRRAKSTKPQSEE